MLIAMFCRLAPRMPAAMIPAMKYWVKRDAVADVVVQHRAEHEQQQHREQQGEDDGLALPEELLELHPGAGAVDAAAATAGPARVADGGHARLSDHPQVHVLERRAGDGQVGHLAGEPGGQLAHERRRRRRSPRCAGRRPRSS